MESEVVEIYKYLHGIPEIGLEEYNTTKFIKEYLSKIDGLQFISSQKEGITGAVCRFRSSHQSKLPTYLFRCDIDALLFKEESGLEYASQNGMHHACGHDAHTSMMLCAAKAISARREHLQRDIILCFQPGEEGKGGAAKLHQHYPNLLEDVEHCFALHVGNHKQTGKVCLPMNYVTANSNSITIEVFGKSSHPLAPHAAIDSNYIGMQIVQEIYSIKNRMLPPDVAMSLTIPKIQGGKSVSALSDYFTLRASIRDYNVEYHQKVIQHIRNFAHGICELHKAKSEVKVSRNLYRSVKNSPLAISKMRKALEENFDEKDIEEVNEGCFAGEDFCQFSQKKPSCYIYLGVALPNSIDPQTKESFNPLHSNKFKLNELSLEKGVKIWESLAFIQ